MKTTMKTLAMGIIAATIFITGCTKDGATGPQGVPGTNGTNGTNGNANVTSTTIVPAVWLWDVSYNRWYFDYTMGTKNLTSSIMAFVVIPGYDTPMPFYNAATGTTTSFSILSDTQIRFIYYSGSSTLTVPTSSDISAINLVIVPPAMIKPGVNPKNYAEVKAAYNL